MILPKTLLTSPSHPCHLPISFCFFNRILNTHDCCEPCLYHFMDHPSTYFQQNTLPERILFMPQLETLLIGFSFACSRSQTTARVDCVKYKQVTEAEVRRCDDGGVSTYMGVVVRPLTLQ